MGEAEAVIGAWTPPSWVCNCFPQPGPEFETVSLDYIIMALQQHIAQITEADSTPLGAAMHAAHILVTLQGSDGLWSAQINLRTGRGVGDGRSEAPVPLMRRLNQLLDSTEYDFTIRRAETAVTRMSGDATKDGLPTDR